MSGARRARYFLRSRRNIVGLLFAAVGLGLIALGLPFEIVAAGVIAGMYVLGYLFAAQSEPSPFLAAETRDAWEVRAQLDELLRAIRMRVADDVYRRVQSIRDAVVFTLANSHGLTEADPNIYLTNQTATVYLPEALSTYLALPRAYAERQPVANGRTSHDVLIEQLYQMDLKMFDVAEQVMRKGSDDLVAHGRFLADRYAGSSLKVGNGPPPPNTLAARTQPEDRERTRVA